MWTGVPLMSESGGSRINDGGPVVVEAPEVEWLQGQIGDENWVMIASELK
jgi:hypothetical protein